MKIKPMRFTLTELEAMRDKDGATLNRFNRVEYYDGFQVATSGIETDSPLTAWAYILQSGGTCGVWYEDGIYYIDHSEHVDTLEEAVRIGRINNQISVLDWLNMECIYL